VDKGVIIYPFFHKETNMESEKRCVSCLAFFVSDELGMSGVFSKQSIAAGVCQTCRKEVKDVKDINAIMLSLWRNREDRRNHLALFDRIMHKS